MALIRRLKKLVWRALLLTMSSRRRRNAEWVRSHTKLHLGCGPFHVDGFLNIDGDSGARGADIVCSLTDLENLYPQGHAELIYASHVLEHLSHEEANEMLGVFYRLLRPGGELRLSVPDMDRIVKIYSENWDHFQTRGHGPWHGLIYGGQESTHDFHKTGFNLCWMKYLLEEWGFSHVSEYPHEPHFLGLTDASLAKDFGEFVSLNVRATK